jgi:hypothetical protein
MPVEALKKRFAIMVGIDLVCGLLAVLVFITDARAGQPWLTWLFYALVAGALAAQVWFILGFRKGGG